MILRAGLFLGVTLGAGVAGVDACSEGNAAAPRFDAGRDGFAPVEGGASDAGGDACNTGGSSVPTCVPFVSCTDLTTPVVSFASDVAPVLNSSCGIGGATCHGDPTAVPFFDVADGGAAFVLSTVVNEPAPEDPAVNIVTPRQPENSMMMHKLDGDQCIYAKECNATGDPLFEECGQRMPINSPQLDLATRDTIRRWIAQGANSN